MVIGRLPATVLGVLLLSGPALGLEGWTKEGDRWIKLVRRGDRKAKGWTNRLAHKLSLPGSYDPESPKRYPTIVHLHGYGGPNLPTNDPKHCGRAFGSLWKKQRGGHHVKQMFYANQALFDWLLAQKRGTPHNYELAVDDGNGARILGFFEPGTAHDLKARAPARAKGEAFAGWTSACDTAVEHTTTAPSKETGTFANAKALTTTFTMPASDVIVTANYRMAAPARARRAPR